MAGGWWLVAGGWWLVAGGWWLVAGGWWLVAGQFDDEGKLALPHSSQTHSSYLNNTMGRTTTFRAEPPRPKKRDTSKVPQSDKLDTTEPKRIPFIDPNAAPAADTDFGRRKLPGTPAGEAQGMLPGMAVIGMYLLVFSMLNAFAAMKNLFGMGAVKYSIFGVCTLMVFGIFGMLRLRRLGWAVVSAGCVLMAAGYFYGFHASHHLPYIIQGLFALVFFLYLSRLEVRERLR